MKTIIYISRMLLFTGIFGFLGNNAFGGVGSPLSFTECPSAITQGLCSPVVNYTATAIGDPVPDITYVFTGATLGSGTGTGSGSTFNPGTTAVTITAANITDTVTCVFDVIIANLPPTINCLQSEVHVPYDPEICGAIVNYLSPELNVQCPCQTPDYIPGYVLVGTLNNHKYFRSTFPTNWNNAKNMAVSLGGHLVTINDAAENEFVRQEALKILSEIYIGFSDAVTEGTWVWTTGEPVTYTHWALFEPNNFGNTDFAAINGTGFWRDINNFSNMRFIVEFDCIGFVQTSGLPSGSFYPVGTTTNSFVVSDANGQVASCSFDIIVHDTTPPVINCPGDQTFNCLNASYIMPTAYDNCISDGAGYVINTTAYEPFDMSLAGEVATCNNCMNDMSLPFNFRYFGIERTSVYISSNGFISFDDAAGVGAGCCSGLTLPNIMFRNSIAVTWTDLYTTMRTQTFGSYPDRVFVVSWEGNEQGESAVINIQLALYEGSNDIKIISINNDNTENVAHLKTMGLNKNALTSVAVPGRNASHWSTSNESLLFSPVIPVTLVSGIPSGGIFPPGTTTVTYSASDASGNTASCSFNIIIIPYMSGEVTVGEGGTFPNLTGVGGLFDSINSNGICGELTAQIISDITEPGTIALNEITYINPDDDHLYILPDINETRHISGNVSQAMIRLDGADNVIINGDLYGFEENNLVFENLNPTQPVLLLSNGASDNLISGCVFSGNNNNASSGIVVLGSSTAAEGNSNNKFRLNIFRNIYESTEFPANLLYSSGSPSAPNSDNNINFNSFINFDQKGVEVTSSGNGSNWNFIYNSFYYTVTPVAKANKIFLNFLPGNTSTNNYINNNYFGGTDISAQGNQWVCSAAGTIKGLVVNSGYTMAYDNQLTNISLSNTGLTHLTGFEVTGGEADFFGNTFGNDDENNGISINGTGTIIGLLSGSTGFVAFSGSYIGDVVFTKTSGSPVFKGIQIKKGRINRNIINNISTTQSNITPTIYGICNIGNGLTEPNEIFNNMVAINTGTSKKPRVYGMFDQSIGIGADFFLNSVYISGTTTNGYFTSAFYRIGNSNTNLYNNILVNDRVANVYAKHYAIHCNSTLSFMSDYNDLYTASGCLGNWGGANYANLTAWRLMTGQDINSLNIMPDFQSSEDLHLVWNENPDMFNAGGPLYTRPFDIDLNLRSLSTPTPGADELYYGGGKNSIIGTDIENQPAVNSLSVYPNPFTSSATISINLTNDDDINIEMYNILGERIFIIAEGSYSAGTHTFNIDANEIPSGTYLCRYVVNGSESIIKRVEIIR